jgi:hypothetical protein
LSILPVKVFNLFYCQETKSEAASEKWGFWDWKNLRGQLFLCYKYKGGGVRRLRSRLAVGSRPRPSAEP